MTSRRSLKKMPVEQLYTELEDATKRVENFDAAGMDTWKESVARKKLEELIQNLSVISSEIEKKLEKATDDELLEQYESLKKSRDQAADEARERLSFITENHATLLEIIDELDQVVKAADTESPNEDQIAQLRKAILNLETFITENSLSTKALNKARIAIEKGRRVHSKMH
ncbi:MAG: hypothetical protein GF411_09390 [Candidatus Lokiarchaeota archaeon]|nr:hypothetical protein [Candidatus Lokiarchaeota archaeon]